MELKTLIIGLCVALGVFAVKSGAGLYYGVCVQKKTLAKMGLPLIYGLSYLAVMTALGALFSHNDIIRSPSTLKWLLQHGTDLHILISTGLIVWGILIISRKPHDGKPGNAAWLALVLPCPVCLTAIGCTVAVVIAATSRSIWRTVGIVWITFTTIGLLTACLYHLISAKLKKDLETTLGAVMIATSIYTLLTMFLSPSLEDAIRVYRIVSQKEAPHSSYPRLQVILWASTLVAFIVGLVSSLSKARKDKPANAYYRAPGVIEIVYGGGLHRRQEK